MVMEPNDVNDTAQQRVKAGISAAVPHLYANGFTTSMTSADVVIVLEQNGAPQSTLNLSFTAAKTLVVKLGEIITRLEAATDRPMLTTDEVDAHMKLALRKGTQ
jgi:hypothetical protein